MSTGTVASASGAPLLSLDRVNYAYRSGGAGVEPVAAVREVSAEFWPGRVSAIVGRSGSGKSTLLSLIAGLAAPDSGEVRWEGQPLARLNLDHYRSRRVGMVFQAFNLLPQLTAAENVMLSLEIAAWPSAQRRSRALELLAGVGITGATAGRRPLRLSGGEQQRVAIARALATDPPLVIADEPTGNLDEETGHEIIALLCGLARQGGRAVLVATHSSALARRADEVWLMRDGRLLPGTAD